MSFTEPERGTGGTTATVYREPPPMGAPGPAPQVPPTAYGGSSPQHMRHENHVHHKMRETKTSFLTTEFWAMLVGIAGLIVLYNWTDNPDMTLWRTCLLCTALASAYILSRGWAKAGSRADHVDVEAERRY